jgi:IS30 family transposase
VGRKPKPAEVRAVFFRARASGATLKQTADAAGVSRTTGHYWLVQSGGVRPRRTMTAIAAELDRSVSTVSREIARNSGVNGYRAVRADRLSTARPARPRAGKLADDPVLRSYVEDKLALHWSPQQISSRLRHDFPDDLAMRVSHETIYTSLFAQSKAVLRAELTTHLRTRRVRRRPQRRISVASRSGRIPEMTRISQRPAEVLDRAIPGHWEGDLLVGRHNRSHLVTLVERHSRLLLVLPLPDARSSSVVAALSTAFAQLPPVMRRSLTWDRGIEMTRHQELTASTGVSVFFCDAYCPWQRRSNENTNGLLRQYSPKKTDLSLITSDALVTSVDQLNRRPRRALAWHSPLDFYQRFLVALSA